MFFYIRLVTSIKSGFFQREFAGFVMPEWIVLIVALPAATGLTWVVLQLGRRGMLLDRPLARSAHTSPMPVSGGLGIVLPFYLLAGFLLLRGSLPQDVFLALLAGMPVAAVGLIDDIRKLDIRTRLPAHAAAAAWALWWLGDVPAIAFPGVSLDTPILLQMLAFLALVWLLNLFNFMDGIDGLAAGEAVFVMLAACLFAVLNANQSGALLSAVLALLCCGFLVWNWPPAKIFMGDVGSAFLGFVIGVLALASMLQGSQNLWSWILLLGVFIVDATYTLLRRVLTGQRWYDGHSTHAYQHAARRFGSHGKVSLGVLLINLFWLAPLAWLSNHYPAAGLLITICGLLPLIALAVLLGAGGAQETGLVSGKHPAAQARKNFDRRIGMTAGRRPRRGET